MSTTTINDMKVYDDLMVGAFYERISQNLDAMNGASAGTLILNSDFKQGDYTKESFFKNTSGLSRRDDTSIADASAAKFTQDEDISVKLKRKFLTEVTRDSFRSLGLSMDEFAQMCGEQMADESKQDALNVTIAALDAAMSATSLINKDVTGAATNGGMNHVNLNSALAMLGDRSSRVKAWVMSGAAFHALLGNMLNGQAPQFNDSGISVYNGGVPTLSRPVIVTDCASLMPTDKHVVLGLQEAAAIATISEATDVVFDDVTGKENLIKRCQAEGAWNLQLKGFRYNTNGGGRNPTTGTVATASNWVQNVTSHKDLPGVRLVVSA